MCFDRPCPAAVLRCSSLCADASAQGVFFCVLLTAPREKKPKKIALRQGGVFNNDDRHVFLKAGPPPQQQPTNPALPRKCTYDITIPRSIDRLYAPPFGLFPTTVLLLAFQRARSAERRMAAERAEPPEGTGVPEGGGGASSASQHKKKSRATYQCPKQN